MASGFQLQIGARYTDAKTTNHVQVLQYGLPLADEQSQNYTNTSGKVSLNWTVDPNNFLYAFVSTGFRPGGLNVPVGLGTPAAFDSEKLTNYEIGWKATGFDGHLRTPDRRASTTTTRISRSSSAIRNFRHSASS